jgi:T5SS/PEP-CTERM-associated repeat protein
MHSRRIHLSLNRVWGCLLVCPLSLAVAAESRAADKYWDHPLSGAIGSGFFNDPADWTNGVAGLDDVAHFDNSVSYPFGYTVRFSTNATNQAMKVETDNVTFNLDGHAYFTTSAFPITIGTVSGKSGRLTITGGTVAALSDNSSLLLGANGAGFLTVTTGGLLAGSGMNIYVGYASPTSALTVNNNGDIIANDVTIGYNAAGIATITGAGSSMLTAALTVARGVTGTLNISGGGVVESSSATIAEFGFGNGTVSVSGPGSKLNDSGHLVVGQQGSATLSVSAGGTVTSTFGYLGNGTGSTGTATIDGANSKWTNSGQMLVGFAGAGILNITGGGQVDDTDGVIGISSGGMGIATVSGLNSKWTNSGYLRVGYEAPATLNITGGGSVTNDDDASIAELTSTGTVTVGGAGSIWSINGKLEVGGGMFTGNGGSGTLRINSGGAVSVVGGIHLWDNDDIYLEGGTLSAHEVIFHSVTASFFWTSGTLHVDNISRGIIVPGEGVMSPGKSLTNAMIVGDYDQQTPGATLEMEIGGTAAGTQYDVLNVSGNVFLGGRLKVSRLNGFMPSASNTFAILQATGNGSIVGAFANVANGQRVQTTDLLGSFIANYGSGSAFDSKLIVLSNFAMHIPGDVNFDGAVNIFDLNLVSQHWGESDSAADANLDGAVDIFDINLISAHWTGGAVLVPEPAAVVPYAIGLVGIAVLGWRRRRTLRHDLIAVDHT